MENLQTVPLLWLLHGTVDSEQSLWKPVSLTFTFSPLSESLSKSQIESIFVHFESCNAYHLFLLKDKKVM